MKNTEKVAKTNEYIEQIIATISHNVHSKNGIDRYKFSSLPDAVGRELLMVWLRNIAISQFDRKTIRRLSITLRTAKPGTIHPISSIAKLRVDSRYAHLDLI